MDFIFAHLYIALNATNEGLLRPLYHHNEYIMDQPTTSNNEAIPYVVYECFPGASLGQNTQQTENNHMTNDSSDYLIPRRTIRQVYNNGEPGLPREPTVCMTMTI